MSVWKGSVNKVAGGDGLRQTKPSLDVRGGLERAKHWLRDVCAEKVAE